MHFDLQRSVALAGFAAAALEVEGKAVLLEAAYLSVLSGSKQCADIGKQSGIGSRIGTRRAPDRRLVDAYDLVKIPDSLQTVIFARQRIRAV